LPEDFKVFDDKAIQELVKQQRKDRNESIVGREVRTASLDAKNPRKSSLRKHSATRSEEAKEPLQPQTGRRQSVREDSSEGRIASRDLKFSGYNKKIPSKITSSGPVPPKKSTDESV